MKSKSLLMIVVAALLAGVGLAQQPDAPRPAKLRVSQGVMAGLLIHKVEPEYPETAKVQQITGTVVLALQIDKQGSVAQVNILSGHPLLVQPAVDAVKQWQFKPYLLNGEPIEVETTATLNFGQNQPQEPSMVRVSQGVMESNLLRRIPPDYPAEAKANHIEGDVILQATIDQEGGVAELKSLQGDPLLAAAAMKAVKQWKYKPFTLNGKPLEVRTTIKVRFVL